MAQQINLYHPAFRKQRKHFSARSAVPALGLVVAACAAVFIYALVQTNRTEALARDFAAQVDAERKQFVAATGKLAANAPSKALEAELVRLEGALKARRGVLRALSTGELGNTSGFSDFFAALGRQAVPGVWIVGLGLAESGDLLQIEGRALRPELVPAYLKALSAEPVMRGRQMTELRLAARRAPEAAAKHETPGTPQRFVEFHFSAPVAAEKALPPSKGASK